MGYWPSPWKEALKVICVSFAFVWCNTDEGDLDTWGKHGTARIKQFNTMKYKCLSIYLSFVFEDGIEMFLKYFWVEKYFTHSPPVDMVIKDALLVLVAIYAICATCCQDPSPISGCFFRFLQGMTVFIFVGEMLRVIGAVYQYDKGIWKSRDCLTITDGKLMQAPFTGGCLRKIDYASVIFTFFVYVVVAICSVYFCCLDDGNSDYEEIREDRSGSPDRPRPIPIPIPIPMAPVTWHLCQILLSKKEVKQGHRQCKKCRRAGIVIEHFFI